MTVSEEVVCVYGAGPVHLYVGVPTPVAPLPISINGFPLHNTVGEAEMPVTVGRGFIVNAAAPEDGVVIGVPQIFVSMQ